MVLLSKNAREILIPKVEEEKPIESKQTDEDTDKKKKKREEVFPQISYERCVFCGLCVDVCPTNCLTMSHEYELSVFTKDNLVYTPEQLSETPSEDEGHYKIKFTKRGVSHAD
jgi:NAD(P)H-quinone oxidoreductase subunit I